MMKLPSWFKFEPTGYWVLQSASAAVAGWTLYAALFSEEARGHIVGNAVLAGINGAAVFHNWLHRKRDRGARRMIRIMDEQQALIRQMHAMKGEEIARIIADQINADIVLIEGPDGPINPNPTKH